MAEREDIARLGIKRTECCVFDKAAHEQAVAKALASGGVVRQAERPKPTLRVVK